MVRNTRTITNNTYFFAIVLSIAIACVLVRLQITGYSEHTEIAYEEYASRLLRHSKQINIGGKDE